MHNDLLGEEMWAREHPEGSLSRRPDPDKVAHHLAGGEITDADRKRNLGQALRNCGKIERAPVRAYLKDQGFEHIADLLAIGTADPRFSAAELWAADFISKHREPAERESLTAPKHKDGFTSESPIRAFSDFQVDGIYAIGKGFRPSLRHLSTYLTALEEKEGWVFAQLVLPDNDASDPTVLFRRAPLIRSRVEVTSEPSFTKPMHEMVDVTMQGYPRCPIDIDGFGEPVLPLPIARGKVEFAPLDVPADDPINPKHYGGTACAEIGELLTANSFQVLRYNWRLGKKDDEKQELGKSIWYLDREIALTRNENQDAPRTLPDHTWFDERLAHADEHGKMVGRILISWNRYGRVESLKGLRKQLQAKLDGLPDIGSGLAV